LFQSFRVQIGLLKTATASSIHVCSSWTRIPGLASGRQVAHDGHPSQPASRFLAQLRFAERTRWRLFADAFRCYPL
jgi:hypothetical protein